jgi:hypothetical protein
VVELVEQAELDFTRRAVDLKREDEAVVGDVVIWPGTAPPTALTKPMIVPAVSRS